MCKVRYGSIFLYFFIYSIHLADDIDFVFGNDPNISLYRELYYKFVNINNIGVVNSVVSQPEKVALNIFNSTNDNVSISGALSENMCLSQKICLAALLGNPICDFNILHSRQMLLQTLFNIDLKPLEHLLLYWPECEQLFFFLLLHEQNFSLITDEKIIEMINVVLLFLKIADYAVSIRHIFDKPNISYFFSGVNDFVHLYQNNREFKECIDYFKTKKKVKKIYFRRYTKIKHLQRFFYFRNVFLRVFVDIITVMVYNNLHKIRNSFCVVSFLPRNEVSDPYVDVVGMSNFYNNAKVDTSFSLTLKKVGVKTLMDINGVFAYDSTAKNLLVNIYLAQVFGIAFAKKFSISIFHKIYTSNLRR